MLGNREGFVEGLGTQNIEFPMVECMFFVGTSGGQQKSDHACATKNIAFPARQCSFWATEKALLRAWERKTLIFLQLTACFCGHKRGPAKE